MVPRAILMKTGLRSLNTASPVNTSHPKTTVYSARPMSRFSKSAQSTVNRPYQIRTTITNKNFSQKVNTAKGKFYTTRPKAVNTARPNLAVVNVVRANQVNAVKASTCWGHPQKKDQGYVDSGCSRHMTGNMSYLSDFKEFDRGYVLLKVPRKNNMYIVDMNNIVPKECLTCLVVKATLDESMLWHRRLGKFDGKSDEGFFVGYSMNSKSFKVMDQSGDHLEPILVDEKLSCFFPFHKQNKDVTIFGAITMTLLNLDMRQTGEEASMSEMEIVYKLDSRPPVSKSSPSRFRT
ncbi:hypothetical protein Tco_0391043 [Tanacetum coccineum]